MPVKIKTLLILLAILIPLFAVITLIAPPPTKNATMSLPTSTSTPTAPTGGNIVTPSDNGTTINLKTGDTFLLKLGNAYNWTNIQVADPSIVSREVNVMVIRGAQGIYRALKPGTTTLTAEGDPFCLKSIPPCEVSSLAFSLNVDVH